MTVEDHQKLLGFNPLTLLMLGETDFSKGGGRLFSCFNPLTLLMLGETSRWQARVGGQGGFQSAHPTDVG